MIQDAIPAIEVKGLECSYEETTVLKDVSFKVRQGEIFFIIGGSGCGKTTLLRNLVGLIRPVAGEVLFNGRSFTSADSSNRRDMLKTFGMLFQSGALWTSLTLAENIALPLEEYTRLPPDEIRNIAAFKLAQVGLTGFETHYPSEISGGMRKRAGLARALALDPSIVFFDEPSAGLDPVSARLLDELIVQIRDTFGTTIVIVSHDVDSIFGIADRAIMLDRAAQGIIAEGRPSDLAEKSSNPKVVEFLTRRAHRAV
ncbi:MAG TPA: ATP-binding cassette domain-containing protein [Opitutaceae bacterium]|nr:ATP-binding cassette domain-containing protein [Opitutaceae bacterium]